MKITLIPLTLLTVAATVAGLPSPLQPAAGGATSDASLSAEKRWCSGLGQSCWRVKRAADALSDSLRTSGDVTARSAHDDAPGGPAYQAKRLVDALALAAAASQPDPAAYYSALALADHFAPDALPDLTTATVAATATTNNDDNDSNNNNNKTDKRWCWGRGQSCWKKAKRTAPAGTDDEHDEVGSESASAAAASPNDKRWCWGQGQSCWKAKRAAESVVRAIERDDDDDDDDDEEEATAKNNNIINNDPSFDPKARVRRDPSPWCQGRGQSCWKTRRDEEDAAARAACHAPGGECTRAERDLHAVYAVARGILDAYEA